MSDFYSYLNAWIESLPPLLSAEAFSRPTQTAIVSVDLIRGFCYEGALASPRVQKIIKPVISLFSLAWESGVRKFLLVQDCHDPEAKEFAGFPPHCIRGSKEVEVVPEFLDLPYYNEMVVIEKNSIHGGLNTRLNPWLHDHPDVDTFIVVGDCTDLCIYQLAMHLRLDANARQMNRKVWIPANCVDTYDLPIKVAQTTGAPAHEGGFFHTVFLYHMGLNGIEIVSSITPR